MTIPTEEQLPKGYKAAADESHVRFLKTLFEAQVEGIRAKDNIVLFEGPGGRQYMAESPTQATPDKIQAVIQDAKDYIYRDLPPEQHGPLEVVGENRAANEFREVLAQEQQAKPSQ